MKYKISLWRDGVSDPSTPERKVLDIPSADESPTGAITPTLIKNINGMKEFSFSLVRHYNTNGELEKNPLIGELIEESKIKVLVGEKWHDFIIKNINESKENDQITYTCQDLASVELGKRGTEIVLNTELENNYGTVEELAKKVLEHSGYSLGSDSEKPYESKEEALYVMQLSSGVSATKAVNSEQIILKKGDYIYIPYSSVEWNSSTSKWIKGSKYERKGYQILWKNGEVFKEIDLQEGRIVYDPDFKYNLILNDLPTGDIFLAGSQSDKSGSASIMKGRFLQESTIATYEPVMDRMIEKVEVTNSAAGTTVGAIVNKYTETEYWTSEITKNLLLNAKDFTSTNMWETTQVGTSQYTIKPKTILTEHKKYKNVLALPSKGSTCRNISLIKSGVKFAPGDKLVYAIKGRLMKKEAKQVSSSTVFMSNSPSIKIGLVDTDTDIESSSVYATPQWTPSQEVGIGLPGAGSKPKTMARDQTYVYNGYVYGLLETTKMMNSPELALKVGSTEGYAFTLEEVQLFKYTVHNGNMIFPEDVPTAEPILRSHYYTIKNGEELRLTANDSFYKPVIRPNYEAVRHIEVAQDSYFNNINVLAEKFNMWVDFHYDRDERGAILKKYVSLYKFNPLSTTNWAGFKYGVNLNDIQRNVNSSQITTKLTVADNNNIFGKNGTASIKRAQANTYGESSIWNFDFYLNKGLLDKEQLARDMYGYRSTDLGFLTKIRELNKELKPIANKVVNMTADLAQSEAFLAIEKEKSSKSLREVNRLSLLLEEYKKMLQQHGKGEIATQSIQNTQKALEKAQAHYHDAEKEKERLTGRIRYYKNELYTNIDKYKGVVTEEDIKKGKIKAGDYFIFNLKVWKAKQNINRIADLPALCTQNPSAKLSLKHFILLDLKRAYTQQFEMMYHRYVAEGQWNDPNQIDDDAYYADAQVLSANNALPQVEYEISLADIGLLDDYELYRFNVGDSTFVEDVEFFGSTKQVINDVIVETPYKKAVVIMESRQVLDDPGQSSIVVKTYKGNHKDLISRVSYGLNSIQKELNNQGQRLSETEKLSTDAKANRFLFENILNNVSNRIDQYSEEFALELANAPGVTLEWLNENVGVLDGDVLATNSIKTRHFETGVMKAISAEVSLVVAEALKADVAFIEALEAHFGKFDLINTGRIESADGSSWWDLDKGEMNISKAVDDRITNTFELGGTGFKFVTERIEERVKATGFSWNIYKGGAILDKADWIKYDADGLSINDEEIFFHSAKKESHIMGYYRPRDYDNILESGKTYTVSFDAKNLRDDEKVGFTMNGFDTFTYVTLEPLEETRVVITGVRDTEKPIQLQVTNTDKGIDLKFEVRNLKIEEGEITNTVFTPHPDELKGEQGVRGLRGLQGERGEQGVPGKTSYTHIAYANNATGTSGFSISDSTNKTYIGIYVDNTLNDSTDPKKYKWTLIKGAQGVKGDRGIPGVKGSDGKTPYLHVAYANSEDGRKDFSVGDSNRSYIGQYTDFTQSDSTDPTKYKWTKIKGEQGVRGLRGLQGEQGEQGIPGAKGADGKSSYTHIAYANNATGTSGFSVSDSINKTYIGIYVDNIQNDSSDPKKYKWTLVKGAQGQKGDKGIPGVKGADGRTPYLHVAYANNETGTSGFSVGDSNRSYIGQYTDYVQADSTDPRKYKWTKIKGEKGDQGIRGLRGFQGEQGEQGIPGKDGKSSYTHIAYANNETGTSGFSVSDSTNKTYIGIYVDNTLNDSSDPKKYRWSLIKGAKGDQGTPGKPGADGKTPYLHIAYANSEDGREDFSVSDSNRSYIGQYTDYTQADSTDFRKYTWSKIQGMDGTAFTWNIYKGGTILDKDRWIKYDANGLDINGEEIVFHTAKNESNIMGYYRLNDYNDILEAGKTYTVSFDAKNLRDNQNIEFTVNGFNSYSYVILEPLEEKRVVITGVRDAESTMQVQATKGGQDIYLKFEMRNLKIEEGAVENTIFTPHPHEMKGEKGDTGEKGKDGSTWTIDSNGYWVKDGAKTEFKAQANTYTELPKPPYEKDLLWFKEAYNFKNNWPMVKPTDRVTLREFVYPGIAKCINSRKTGDFQWNDFQFILVDADDVEFVTSEFPPSNEFKIWYDVISGKFKKFDGNTWVEIVDEEVLNRLNDFDVQFVKMSSKIEQIDDEISLFSQKITETKDFIEKNTTDLKVMSDSVVVEFNKYEEMINDNGKAIQALQAQIVSGQTDDGNVYTEWKADPSIDNYARFGSEGIFLISSGESTFSVSNGVAEVTSLYVQDKLGLGNHTSQKYGDEFTLILPNRG